jgi:hypothetical protein
MTLPTPMPGGASLASDDTDGADEHAGGDEGAPRLVRHVAFLAALVAVVVLIVGSIGPPLFGDGVFLAADQTTLAFPWQAYDSPVKEHIGHHGPVTDTLDAAYPARVAVAESIRDGHFFGWNPYAAGGAAAAAESSSGTLSPFGMIYAIAPSWFAPALIKLVQMAVAVGFTFLFGRRVGLGRLPALFAGAAFAGSGFLVMWTNWPQPEVAALIAPLFWATERYLQGPSVARAAPIAVVVAAMLLGNFPAVAGYAVFALAVYVAMRLLVDADRPVVPRLAIGAGAGAGLIAGVTLVAAVMLPFLARLGDLDLSSREQDGGSIVGLAGLVTAVAPKALGLSTEAGWFGPRNQVETVAFVGASTMILAIVALCLPRPRSTPRATRLGLVVVTAVFGVATYVGGPVLDLLQRLPVFSNNFIGRSTSVMGFTVAVLGGMGLQALAERRAPATRAQRLGVAGVVLAASAVLVLVVLRAADLADEAGRSDDLGEALRLPALVAIVTLALVPLVRSRRPALSHLAMVGVAALLVVESLTLSLPLLPNEDEHLLYASTPGIDFLAANVGHERIAPEGRTLFANATSLFGLRSTSGHSFTAETWKQALRTADPGAFGGSPTLSQLSAEPEVVTSPMLDRLGARWFVAGAGHIPLGQPEWTQLAGSTCDDPVVLDEPASVTIPAGEGLRGLYLRVCGEVEVPHDANLVTTAAVGDEAVQGTLQLPDRLGEGHISIAVPADDLAGTDGGADPDEDMTLTFEIVGADGAAPALATTAYGTIAVDLIRPVDDDLRLVYADDVRIYERTSALPRIRWAGRAEVETDPEERLRRLGDGDVDDDTVLLSDPGPRGSGGAGEVDVVLDAPTAVQIDVEAEGDGYLVVADAMQNDWVATVDGEPAALVAADHAGVAVAVPEGTHRVELRYRPRGQRAGLALSGLTALGLVGALAAERLVRARRARRDAAAGSS